MWSSKHPALLLGSLLSALAHVARAETLNLNELQPIADFSDGCSDAYSQEIGDCTREEVSLDGAIDQDAGSGVCSLECIDSLTAATNEIKSACGTVRAARTSLIGMIFSRSAVGYLCPNSEDGVGPEPTSRDDPPDSADEESEAEDDEAEDEAEDEEEETDEEETDEEETDEEEADEEETDGEDEEEQDSESDSEEDEPEEADSDDDGSPFAVSEGDSESGATRLGSVHIASLSLLGPTLSALAVSLWG